MHPSFDAEVTHPPGEHVRTPAGALWCEVEGEGDELALIVGGGPGVGHSHYHPWFSRLAVGRRIVYYDHPGTGRSDAGSEYTVAAYVEAIEGLRLHLGTAQLGLIALSFGGIPAIAYALAHPKAVDRLVLCNAQVGATGWQAGNIDNVNRALAAHLPVAWEKLLQLRRVGVRSLADEYQALLAPIVEHLEWAEPWNHPVLQDDPVEKFQVDVYRAFIGDDPEWEVTGTLAGYEPHLGCVRAPTLVTAGRWDRLTPPAMAHAIHAELPNAVLAVFEQSAHRPWAEEPDLWFAAVDDFLRRA